MIFKYKALHIPSGEITYREQRFSDETAFLLALDRWNSAGFGMWQYARHTEVL